MRRRYTPEYKREAVELVLCSGKPLSHIARDLGLNAPMLSRWRREHEQAGLLAFSGHGNARDEELFRVKRELSQVKKERDFLKDAAVFFAKASK